jgi:hypothetical protein
MKFKTIEEVKRYFEMFGFEECKDHWKNSQLMMEKWIYDLVFGNKKYAIHIYVYNLSKYTSINTISYQSDVQFKLKGEGTVDITLFGMNFMNDEIHKFFEKFYNNFNCLPYERS